MSIKQLTIQNFEHLDGGKAALSFNAHIQRVAMDCMDRPGDPRARKVTLSVDLTPVLGEDGSADEVKMKFHVKSSVPDHKSKVYSLGMRMNGVLIFNEDSPEAIDQSTFLED